MGASKGIRGQFFDSSVEKLDGFSVAREGKFSTLRFEKFIFDYGNASVKNVKLQKIHTYFWKYRNRF
jgi:hypothetical protein